MTRTAADTHDDARNRRSRPLTPKQRRLLKARAAGHSLAESARRAGYRCKDGHSATQTAATTLRRLTRRPEMRQAMANRGLDLTWVARRLKDLADSDTVTEIRDAAGKVRRRIVTRDGRMAMWVVKIVMQVFDAFGDGEPPNPLADVSDEDLDTLVASLESTVRTEPGHGSQADSTLVCPDAEKPAPAIARPVTHRAPV